MAKNNFLERITLKVKEQVEREKKQWPVESLEEAFKKGCRLPSFREAFLKKKYPNIISEIKFGSPSVGTIRPRSEGDSVNIAGQYLKERSSALNAVIVTDWGVIKNVILVWDLNGTLVQGRRKALGVTRPLL